MYFSFLPKRLLHSEWAFGADSTGLTCLIRLEGKTASNDGLYFEIHCGSSAAPGGSFNI